jgi:type IV secretion system protein VirD4
MQEVQRPMLTPDECQRMSGPQKDEHDRITAAGDMVIYCAGFPAIYGRQPLYFEDKTFAARAAIPHRDAAHPALRRGMRSSPRILSREKNSSY